MGSMDTVTEPVSFISGGETLVGRLVVPAGLQNGRLAAVVIAGGQTCVKEQMAERCARRLAEHGYAGLAFDFRGFGESGGRPRDYESSVRKIEDLRSALSFLAGRSAIDPGRLAALGIGVGAGHVAVEAADDPRVAALALVAPGLQDSQIVQDRYGGAEGVEERRARGEAARRRYEQSGQVDYEPVVSPDDPPAWSVSSSTHAGAASPSGVTGSRSWHGPSGWTSTRSARRQRLPCRPCWCTASGPPTPKPPADSSIGCPAPRPSCGRTVSNSIFTTRSPRSPTRSARWSSTSAPPSGDEPERPGSQATFKVSG